MKTTLKKPLKSGKNKGKITKVEKVTEGENEFIEITIKAENNQELPVHIFYFETASTNNKLGSILSNFGVEHNETVNLKELLEGEEITFEVMKDEHGFLILEKSIKPKKESILPWR